MSESLESDGLLDIPFHGRSIEPLYKEISEYQQLLDVGSLSEEDRQAFINSLDERWPYMNQMITVSGNIWLPMYEDDSQQVPIMQMSYVEDVGVESLGFSTLTLGYNRESEGIRSIGHYFVMDPEQTMRRPMETRIRVQHGFARPEDVVITYPFIDEAEDAARLSYFFEETIADIDNAFISADDECEAVKALGEIEFTIRSDDTYDELSLITKYINSHLTFDHKVPYLLDFEGFCYVADADGKISNNAFASEGTTIAYPLAIETTSSFRPDDEDPTKIVTEIALGLRIELLANTKELDSGKQLIVPIDDAFQMQSLRPLIKTAINSMVDTD